VTAATLRAQRPGPARREHAAPAAAGRSRLTLPLVAGLVLAALFLTALRVDILRMRYAKAEALEREAILRRERSELVVAVRRLRHPGRLARLAEERGFVRPRSVARLEAPAPVTVAARPAAPVSAGGERP